MALPCKAPGCATRSASPSLPRLLHRMLPSVAAAKIMSLLEDSDTNGEFHAEVALPTAKPWPRHATSCLPVTSGPQMGSPTLALGLRQPPLSSEAAPGMRLHMSIPPEPWLRPLPLPLLLILRALLLAASLLLLSLGVAPPSTSAPAASTATAAPAAAGARGRELVIPGSSVTQEVPSHCRPCDQRQARAGNSAGPVSSSSSQREDPATALRPPIPSPSSSMCHSASWTASCGTARAPLALITRASAAYSEALSVTGYQILKVSNGDLNLRLAWLVKGHFLPVTSLKIFSLPTWGKIALISAITVPVVLLGATLYRLVRRVSSRVEWTEALTKSYYSVVSGFPEFQNESASSAGVLVVLQIVGMSVFAGVVGFVSNEVSDAIERTQRGNHPVHESRHTVLLGWNRQTVPLLKQIMLVQQERGCDTFGKPILILADRPKESMDCELADELGADVARQAIMSRSGTPMKVSDMRRVAIGRAQTVVVMSPRAEEQEMSHETRLVSMLMNIHAAHIKGAQSNTLNPLSGVPVSGKQNEDRRQKIIVEDRRQGMSPDNNVSSAGGQEDAFTDVGKQNAIPAGRKQKVILEAVTDIEHMLQDTGAGNLLKEMVASNDFSITTVPALKNLAYLMAQCMAQPGLARVFRELTTQSTGSSEFYIKAEPRTAGLTFGQARRMYDASTLCGVFEGKTGLLQLNPPDQFILQPGDRSLLLAADNRRLAPREGPLEVEPLPKNLPPARRPSKASPTASASLDGSLPLAVPRTQKKARTHFMVLSYSSKVSPMLARIEEILTGQDKTLTGLDKSFNVKVVTESPVTDRHSFRQRRVTASYAISSLHSTEGLIKAGLADADSAVINLQLGVPDHIADAQVVAAVMQLRGALAVIKGRSRPLVVVCCIANPETAQILSDVVNTFHGPEGHRMLLDVIEYRTILGGMLTQVAAEPQLQTVFADLFDGAGDIVCKRSLANYGLDAEQRQYQWGQLQEVVRSREELLLGYMKNK